MHVLISVSCQRAEPDGVIDPMVPLVSFWNDDEPVVVVSYYATHLLQLLFPKGGMNNVDKVTLKAENILML